MSEYGSGPEDHAWYAGRLAPGARLEVWTDAERTDRVVQIKDPRGEAYPDGVVVCDDLGRYAFDTVNDYDDLWISPVGSVRTYRLRRADIGARLGVVESTTSSLVGQVDTLSGRVDVAAPQAAAAHQAATALQDSIGRSNGLAPLDDAGRIPAEHLGPGAAGGGTGYLSVLSYGAQGDGETDDTTAIRSALDEAANRPGATVYLPPHRVFVISGPLYVQHGTRIVAHGATVRRSGSNGWLLLNRHPSIEPTAEGYEGHGDITVEGGLWDAAGSEVTSGGHVNTFSIAHGRNLTFRDLTIRDVPGNHAIEVNGCENVLIENCRFEGYSHDEGEREFSEAVQLDLMKGSSYFGAFGPYDHTPCRNVTVRGCWFGASPEPGAGGREVVAWSRGVGSHSATIGRYHENVLIEGNHFDGLSQWAVGAYNWRDSTIVNNLVSQCGAGVWVRSVDTTKAADTEDVDGNQTGDSQHIGNMVIANNMMRGLTGAGNGIRLEGEETGRIVRAVVTGNMLRNVASPQTGIRGLYLVGCRIVGNIVSGVGSTGVSMLAINDTAISDNTVQESDSAGITVDNRPEGEHVTLSGNMVMDPGGNGIWLIGGMHYLLEGNLVVGASAGEDLGSDGIRMADGVNGVSVIGNRVRQRPGAANSPAWGMSITSSCLNIRRGDNDFTVSGVTGEVSDDQTTGWIEPSFTNGWGHFSGTGTWQPARYRKDMAGRIWVEGVIGGGTVNEVAFTLPEDMRPAVDRAFACLSSSSSLPTISRVVVAADGTVTPRDEVDNFVSVEFTFEAADI